MRPLAVAGGGAETRPSADYRKNASTMRSLLPFALATTACFANGNARSVVVEHAFGPKAEVRYVVSFVLSSSASRFPSPSAVDVKLAMLQLQMERGDAYTIPLLYFLVYLPLLYPMRWGFETPV